MSAEGSWLGAKVSADPRPLPPQTPTTYFDRGEGASTVAAAVAASSSGPPSQPVPRAHHFQAVALDGTPGGAQVQAQAGGGRGRNGGGVRLKAGSGYDAGGGSGGVSAGVDGGGGSAAAGGASQASVSYTMPRLIDSFAHLQVFCRRVVLFLAVGLLRCLSVSILFAPFSVFVLVSFFRGLVRVWCPLTPAV